MAKSGNLEVVNSRIQLRIPLIFNVHFYSKIAVSPMADSTESIRGNSTFKNGVLGCLSGSVSTEAHNRSLKSPNIFLVADKGR